LGLVLFADRVLEEHRPRPGRAQLFRILRAILGHTVPWQRPVANSDPRAAIHAVEKRRGHFAVFLISDLIDHDVPEDLRYLRDRHDVTLLHVYDPLEYADPGGAAPVRLQARASEGGAAAVPVALGAGETLEGAQTWLRQRCGALRMDYASIPTTQPARHALGPLFHRRR
ncbi:MAG: hypothetical protein AAFY88_04795, partial [Acidobacteriota bacterium]